MRTTLDIDDAVLAAARSIAADEGISVGTAVSALALKGLTAVGPVDISGTFPAFAAPSGQPPITLEMVTEHRD